MSGLLADLRHAIRVLAKSPGLTATAILTLALGIGANGAIFGVLNGVLLRALPVPRPHDLRVVGCAGRAMSLSNYEGAGMVRYGADGSMISSFPYPLYREFRDEVRALADVFAFTNLRDLTVVGPDGASTAPGVLVSGNYFSAYRAKALIGRTLLTDDDRAGVPLVAVVSHRWWERHAGLDPGILGRTVSLNRKPVVVVGVLPREHLSPLFGREADVYLPLSAQPQFVEDHPLEARDHWWLEIMCRLSAGSDATRVQSTMQALLLRHLATLGSAIQIEQPTIVLQDGSRGGLTRRTRLTVPLLALQGVVSLVLVIVCINLSSLLLVRAAGRRHEMAVRAALGAGRGRLIRQSLSEGLVLALAGGVLSLIVAASLKAALLHAMGRFIEDLRVDVTADSRVLIYTLGVSVLALLLFGALPARRASQASLVGELAVGRGVGKHRPTLGRRLVVVQVALSLLLVAGSALLLRTVAGLDAIDPGFTTDSLLVFQVNAEQAGHEGSDRLSFYDRVRERLAGLPGVRSVGLSTNPLLGGRRSSTGVTIPGGTAEPGTDSGADEFLVDGGFFSTMEIPILVGQAFTNAEERAGKRVAVVNERFVERYLLGQYPIGRTFERQQGGAARDYEIVGVCRDVKYDSLRREVRPTMYLSYGSEPPPAIFFEVHSAPPPLSLVPAVRRAVAAIDASVPLASLSTQRALRERATLPERLLATLCGAFAALAMLLSCIGLYGLVAGEVTRRTPEFGVRVALGAAPSRIARSVIGDALATVGWGVAFGLPAALALSFAMRGVLYGVEPLDPLSMLAAVAALLLVGCVAAYLPARRAARIDPMVALRCE